MGNRSLLSDPEFIAVALARKAAAVRALATGRTAMTFWKQLDFAGVSSWDGRAAEAARHVPPGSRVIDYGCAIMRLEPALPPGCTYLPVDLVARDHRTTVADLNKKVPALEADVVVGLGVLEYILDMPRFLRRVVRQAPLAIFSYHPLERNIKKDRFALAWVNALNTVELTAIMTWAGYRNIRTLGVGGHPRASQLLYVAESPRARGLTASKLA